MVKFTIERATSAQDGEGGQRHAAAALGGWVSPRAGLDGCGKSRPHRDSIPVQPVASRYTD